MEENKPDKLKKIKQIMAIIGIIILVGMYVLSLVASLSSWENSKEIFAASIFCSFFIPVIIYVIQLFYKKLHG